MWHEARKQEKKIRGLMVDYKRRAERRRDYYEKIKTDPTQFIQVHGRPYKIHLDPAVALAADSPSTMMSWQGDRDIMIDRFDVRAHLDFIPEVKHKDVELTEEESQEERFQNYERYRILVQNDFLGIPEDKFFAQLALEEQYGPIAKNETSVEGKKKSQLSAAIGFKYDDEAATSSSGSKATEVASKEEEDEDEEDEDSDMDFDLSVDVSKVDTANAIELNNCAHAYGMQSNDYFSYLTRDMEEAENLRLAKEEEEEKALFSGRKSRRERRAFREKTMVGRRMSPLSYAAVSPAYGISKENEIISSLSKSKSRSPSPVNSGKIMYITSFGETEEEPPSQSARSRSKDRTSRDSKSSSRYRSSSKHSSSRRKSYNSKSRSRTRSPHTRRVSKRSRTKSKSPKKVKSPEKQTSPKTASSRSPPVKRYYGRNVRDSSSELEISDSDTSSNSKPPAPTTNSKPLTKPVAVSLKITPQERLKKKMQKLLNKQFKADKKAEQEKIQKLEQERLERAEEMKELSLKLKMKERQRRYNSDEDWNDDDEDDEKSDKSEENKRSRSVSSSRSRTYRNRSRSPIRRRSPLLKSPEYPRHISRYNHNQSREYDTRDHDRTHQEIDDSRCYQSRGRDRDYQSRDQDNSSCPGRSLDSRYEPRDQDRSYQPRDSDRSYGYYERDSDRNYGHYDAPPSRHDRFNNTRRHNQEYPSERGRDFESSNNYRNGRSLHNNSRSREDSNYESRRSYNSNFNREDRSSNRGSGSDRSRNDYDRSRRKEEYPSSRYGSRQSKSPNSSRLVDY